MKKLLFVLLAASMLFSCQKKNADTTPALQDVSFNATEIIPDVSREDWDCIAEAPTHAWVQIKQGATITDYDLELFTVGGGLYTQSIKLLSGTYTVENFVLYIQGNSDPGIQAEDIITHGTPIGGTEYAGYVGTPLPIEFTVTDFEKEDIYIEVLCFNDIYYEAFGFDWFEIIQIDLDHICFFGDICLNGEPFTPSDFNGSLYGDDLPIDVPAIMQVIVKQGGDFVAEFNNELAQTVPLCVPYNADNAYTFELYLWLPAAGGGFSYQLYATYTTDELLDNLGTDLIFDFVVGTCGYGDPGDPSAPDDQFNFIYTPPVPLCGYGVVTSSALNYSDGGWAGWSVPAGKVVTGGGFQLTGGPASTSAPGLPGSIWPHWTFGANEYGWVVNDNPDGANSYGSYVYAIYGDMPEGYEVIWSNVLNYNGQGGWGGWSAPAGKVVLGGGFVANGPVKVSAPGLPGVTYPHGYTYGPNEYGWVVQDAGATQIQIYVICANEPAGYEIVKSPEMSYSGTGWAGWSVPGKVVLGGGFEGVSPVMASRPCQPGETTPFGYTYGANEWGWLVQSSGGGAGWIYVIYADICGN